MSFLISDIRKAKAESRFRYLFDANIWLAVLDDTFYKPEYKPYTDFFNSIINNTHVSDAKIAMPCLLLSEILNRLISDIYYPEFQTYRNNYPQDGQSKSSHIKNKYRVHPDYAIDLENACASIRAYHDKLEFVSDNLNKYTCKTLIKKIPLHLDINDYLFSKMALEQGLVIVTNDADFKVEDIYIITSRRDLLDLSTVKALI